MHTEKNTLRETVDRGSSLIPFYVYHHHWNNYSLYLHWHSELEIIYVEKGSLVFIVNTMPIKISDGQCIVINSGQLHSAHCINNETSHIHALLFNPNFLSSMASDYCQSTFIAPLLNGQYRLPLIIDEKSDCGTAVISEIKETIKIYDEKEFGFELGIKAALYKIIFLIARENKLIIEEPTASSVNYKINTIKKALNYIERNFSKKIYIEDLAKEVNMNPQYFCRFFKFNVGKTPVDFINQYRIEQAANMIKLGDKKISDICLEVGFDNFSYFIKKFKLYKKSTPSKYRQII